MLRFQVHRGRFYRRRLSSALSSAQAVTARNPRASPRGRAGNFHRLDRGVWVSSTRRRPDIVGSPRGPQACGSIRERAFASPSPIPQARPIADRKWR